MKAILKTNNLCRDFKKQKAVNNVSITVRENSIYGLLGPNGAGKSATLKMITGMLRPTTVILSSHILSEVQLIADDIGIISNGILGYLLPETDAP